MWTCGCDQSYKGVVYGFVGHVIRGFYPARKEKEGISSRNGDGHWYRKAR